jgi:hypothetical protein
MKAPLFLNPVGTVVSDREARRRAIACCAGLWLIAAAAGLGALASYAARPGGADPSPLTWPSASSIQRQPGHWTLLLFLHPRCPCSRATLAELERLQAKTGERLDIQLAFLAPADNDSGFVDSDLWRRARALPDVIPVRDPGGRECRRFGARTSGEALLYDPAGRLAYRGGITPARGHEGDNAGSDAILHLVNRNTLTLPAEAISGPAFGCPLQSPTAQLHSPAAQQSPAALARKEPRS